MRFATQTVAAHASSALAHRALSKAILRIAFASSPCARVLTVVDSLHV